MNYIRNRLKTAGNWLRRISFYGAGNSLRIYRGVKSAGIFRVRISEKDFFLRGRSVDFAVFNGIFANGEYDFDIDFEPRYIVDAGAFIGASSVWFSQRYPEAVIIAFEPEESNFEMLKKNTTEYKNIIPVHAALFPEDTALKIKDPDAEKYAFRVERVTAGISGINGITVDSVMNYFGLPQIDILKMDIEGAEYDIFSSTDTGWLHRVGVLVIELHEYFRPGVTELFYSVVKQLHHDEMRRGENIIIFNRGIGR
ncbi:MAG: FkbM family methyltransferase [Actinomycetota bacterium]